MYSKKARILWTGNFLVKPSTLHNPSINPSKSTSIDGISMKLVRQLKHQLLPVLLHLVNTTIITSKYPQSLKTSKIIPLIKKR